MLGFKDWFNLVLNASVVSGLLAARRAVSDSTWYDQVVARGAATHSMSYGYAQCTANNGPPNFHCNAPRVYNSKHLPFSHCIAHLFGEVCRSGPFCWRSRPVFSDWRMSSLGDSRRIDNNVWLKDKR